MLLKKLWDDQDFYHKKYFWEKAKKCLKNVVKSSNISKCDRITDFHDMVGGLRYVWQCIKILGSKNKY